MVRIDNTTHMKIECKTFFCSKPGESLCQDSVYMNLELNKIAISDGVSQSFYPEIFSRLLVEEFCNNSNNDLLFSNSTWKDWLLPIQEKWNNLVRERVNLLPQESWIIRNKFLLKKPAAATFAGIEFFRQSNEDYFRIAIIGDSCIFHIRNYELKNSYIIQSSKDFDNFPEYFSSDSTDGEFNPIFKQETLRNGDVLFLATDELSKWILSINENSERNWRGLLHKISRLFYDEINFNEFIRTARNRESEIPLGDDDYALAIIRIFRNRNNKNKK